MAITRLWQAGAETQSTDEVPLYYLTGGGNPISIDATTKKTGGYGFKFYTGSSSNTAWAGWAIPSTRQIRVALSHYEESLWGGTATQTGAGYRVIDSSNNVLVSLSLGLTGSLNLWVGTTLIETITGCRSAGSWYHYALDIKIDSSSGWVYFYCGGVQKAYATGNTGSADIYLAGIYENTTSTNITAYFDDLYIDDTTGEAAPATPPVKRFYAISPVAGAPTYAQWTGSDGNKVDNYALIDEAPPDTADYIYSMVADELDSSQMSTFTLGASEVIDAMIPTVLCRRAGVTERIALGTRYSGTDSIGSDIVPDLAWSYKFERQTARPGGGAWDQTAIDDVELVVKARGSY